jgi:Family of unknown function (DUF6247)
VSAQPVSQEDPRDPQVILEGLPEQERPEFLCQYHDAVAAAHDPAGYKRLQQVLHVWSLVVIATNQPDYYEDLAAVRRGAGQAVPAESAIPGWRERIAAARKARP